MTALTTTRQRRWRLVRIAAVTAPAVLLLGTLSGRIANSGDDNAWFAGLSKPDIYPPGEVFGIVWTILYLLMGISLAMIIDAQGARRRNDAILLFGAQLALNLAWSPLFFRLHKLGASFLLILAILAAAGATAVMFASIRRVAGYLLVPYLSWLGFAAVLSWRIWAQNS